MFPELTCFLFLQYFVPTVHIHEVQIRKVFKIKLNRKKNTFKCTQHSGNEIRHEPPYLCVSSRDWQRHFFPYEATVGERSQVLMMSQVCVCVCVFINEPVMSAVNLHVSAVFIHFHAPMPESIEERSCFSPQGYRSCRSDAAPAGQLLSAGHLNREF